MESTPTHRYSKAVVITALVLGMLVPVAANAAAGFTDVDDASPFVSDIKWLADTGVTQGCNPPANDRFCPKDYVTREQMAAFLHRLADNQVVDAGTLNGLTDTAFMTHGFITTGNGGTGWLEHASPPSTVSRNGVDTTVSGDGMMVLPLTGPTSINGVTYELRMIDFCFTKFSGDAYIDNVAVYRQNVNASSTTIMNASLDRSLTGCWIYEVRDLVNQGASIVVKTGGSSTDTIRLGSVRAFWMLEGYEPVSAEY